MTEEIFISGKITGEPIIECLNKFRLAEVHLRAKFPQANIHNPLELEGIHFGIEHPEAMKICLERLARCSHIFMLRDYKDSAGAILEHAEADFRDLEIIYQ